MGRVRVHAFSMSIDGYGAGPDQGVDNPLGINGHRLHEWIFKTRYGRAMTGGEDGETGIDNDLFARRDEGIGATIMGRNMYGPIRGPWGDSQWTGW
jgi:dihydrofolate reductase